MQATHRNLFFFFLNATPALLDAVWIFFFEAYVIAREFDSKEAQTAANHAAVFDWIRGLEPLWRYGGFMQN